MGKIVIKTQEQLDALPSSFEKFTIIEIISDYCIYVKVVRGNSRVVARGNSHVEAHENSRVEARGNSLIVAWGNSRVEAWGNSHVEGFLCSTIICNSVWVTIKSLLDNSRLIYKIENAKRPEKLDSTAIITEHGDLVTPSFEQWLERGYVMADGILKKHKKTKQLENGLTLYEVASEFETETSYAVSNGKEFSHGKTIRQAVSDLIFKISERDSSKYRGIKLNKVFNVQDAIVMYRTITGACSQGVEEFLERNFSNKEEVSVSEIIKITEGHYGHEQFKNFGWGFMKKKLTRKQAERILAEKFNESIYNIEGLDALCLVMPDELLNEWNKYWTKINTHRVQYMWQYLRQETTCQEVTFLRLLTAHLFIRHVYGEE
jgi:hypothetical protein